MRIEELKEKEDQARYGAELSLSTREYHHMKSCAMRLIAIDNEIETLMGEAKSLREETEREEWKSM
jgi:hypothetical protein